jgi:hypothetical protein
VNRLQQYRRTIGKIRGWQRAGEPGRWFRLHDGRVFSSSGEPENGDPRDYD